MYIFPNPKYSLRIALIAFSSPKHPALSNSLAIETLSGDLKGAFGEKVTTALYRADNDKSLSSIIFNLKKFIPDLIGISIQPGSLKILDAFFTIINHYPYFHNSLYLFGNQLPTYFPAQFIQRYPQNNIIIVRGEGELPLRRIVKSIFDGNASLNTIPNIVYRNLKGKIIFNYLEKTRLRELIYPPSVNGLNELIEREGFALIESSRGCSYGRCVYCTRKSFRFGKGWEPFPLDRVFKNFSNLLDVGFQCAEFVDDEFFGGRNIDNIKRIYKLAESIENLQKNKGTNLTFGIMTTPNVLYRPDDISGNSQIEHLLKKLRNAGLGKVYWGIEALCYSQLVRYGRKNWMQNQTDVETQYKHIIQLLRKLDIESEVGFAMLDPLLSLEELQENLEVFERLKIFNHNMWPFRPLVVNEGSSLVKKLDRLGQLGQVNLDFMCYECEYQDPRITIIAQAIKEVDIRLPELMPYIYQARTISRKRFPGQKKTTEVEMAEKFVRINAFAYLNLIRKCLACLIDTSPEKPVSLKKTEEIKSIINETVKRLNEMLKGLKKALKNGILSI